MVWIPDKWCMTSYLFIEKNSGEAGTDHLVTHGNTGEDNSCMDKAPGDHADKSECEFLCQGRCQVNHQPPISPRSVVMVYGVNCLLLVVVKDYFKFARISFKSGKIWRTFENVLFAMTPKQNLFFPLPFKSLLSILFNIVTISAKSLWLGYT